MEMIAPVKLDLPAMRRVVDREGGCVVWGGTLGISPADDILIHVERPLDFDSDGQLTASVLSKKMAAGSTHVLIDIPVGPTAKVRSAASAHGLSKRLIEVAKAVGLTVKIVETDGMQPVGRGIGPALEARDVLSVLKQADNAPADLRQRALDLAGHLLELGGKAAAGRGASEALALLDSGRAWGKFVAICEAQGGMREPPLSTHRHVIGAARRGRVAWMDNRRLARIAKLAGAPRSPAAGVDLHHRIGDQVDAGEPLYTIHAQSPGELAYALSYVETHGDAIAVESGEPTAVA
jgi:thymidine phosphorylase